ncbi:MAG: hypothetical protein ACRYG5_09945 [Janthinobacterium lividum]
MRFHISTRSPDDGQVLLEIIGDLVDLPNSCGEQFAVHMNRFNEVDEVFRVTHVGSGFSVAGGVTIDAAIEAARRLMDAQTEDSVRAAIARAKAEATS